METQEEYLLKMKYDNEQIAKEYRRQYCKELALRYAIDMHSKETNYYNTTVQDISANESGILNNADRIYNWLIK